MSKKLLTIIIGLIFLNNLYSQETEDYIRKIDLKLKRDKSYLNINYINFKPEANSDPLLKGIPRTDKKEPFDFKVKDNVDYTIVFLKESPELDSVVILYVDEITSGAAEGDNLFGGVGGPQNDTTRVLKFKDIYTLKLTNKSYYDRLYNIVQETLIKSEDDNPATLLKINPDREIKLGLGMTARDNADYLNFARINANHWYPKEKKIVGKGRQKTVESADFRIDASFSSLSFSHKIMDFSLGGASLELGVTDRVLNLLPWQSMALNGGFRTIFSLSDGKNLNESSYLDAKFLARVKLNSPKLATSIPFIIGDTSRLNLGNAIIGEFTFTRPFNLPFLNFYFAAGQQDFKKPGSMIVNKLNNTRYAYFSFSQAEFNMSFYWNSTDKLVNRFRIDVGAAYHDIWKADYDQTNKFISSRLLQNNISPVFVIHYNFVPDGNPLLGGRIRYYDSRLNFMAWLKVVEIAQVHTLRLEALYITSPFARQMQEWEFDGSMMFQLRYRYGL